MPTKLLAVIAGVGLVFTLACGPASLPLLTDQAAAPEDTPRLLGPTRGYFSHLSVDLPDSGYVAVVAITPRGRLERLYPADGQASPLFPPGVHEIPARRLLPATAQSGSSDWAVSVVFPVGHGGNRSIAELSFTPSARDAPSVVALPTLAASSTAFASRPAPVYVLTAQTLLRAADLDRLLAAVDTNAPPDSVLATLARGLGWRTGPRRWGGPTAR